MVGWPNKCVRKEKFLNVRSEASVYIKLAYVSAPHVHAKRVMIMLRLSRPSDIPSTPSVLLLKAARDAAETAALEVCAPPGLSEL